MHGKVVALCCWEQISGRCTLQMALACACLWCGCQAKLRVPWPPAGRLADLVHVTGDLVKPRLTRSPSYCAGTRSAAAALQATPPFPSPPPPSISLSFLSSPVCIGRNDILTGLRPCFLGPGVLGACLARARPGSRAQASGPVHGDRKEEKKGAHHTIGSRDQGGRVTSIPAFRCSPRPEPCQVRMSMVRRTGSRTHLHNAKQARRNERRNRAKHKS